MENEINDITEQENALLTQKKSAREKLSRFIKVHRNLLDIKSHAKLGQLFSRPIRKPTMAAYENGINPIPMRLWPEFARVLDLNKKEYFDFLTINFELLEVSEMYQLSKDNIQHNTSFSNLICYLKAVMFLFHEYEPKITNKFLEDCIRLSNQIRYQVTDEIKPENVSLKIKDLNENTRSIKVQSPNEISGTLNMNGKTYNIIEDHNTEH